MWRVLCGNGGDAFRHFAKQAAHPTAHVRSPHCLLVQHYSQRSHATYHSKYSLFGCRRPVNQLASRRSRPRELTRRSPQAGPHTRAHRHQLQRREYAASSFAANLAVAAAAVIAFLFFVVADCICKFMTACFGIKGARSYTTCFPQLNGISIPRAMWMDLARAPSIALMRVQRTQVIKFLSTSVHSSTCIYVCT